MQSKIKRKDDKKLEGTVCLTSTYYGIFTTFMIFLILINGTELRIENNIEHDWLVIKRVFPLISTYSMIIE